MLCYNVGDSYTYFNVGDGHSSNWNWCPDVKDHYWWRIAQEKYNCTKFINESLPGRSNDAMIKLVMRHCLENPNLSTLYFINVTTIFRIDITEPQSHTLHDILTPKAVSELNFEILECNLYANLIGLIEFLKARNKQFLIFNNSKTFRDNLLPKRDRFVEYFKREPRIINWFEHSRATFHETVSKIKPVDYNLYQWNGHDGPAGHDAYFRMLWTRLPDLPLG